MIRGWYYNKKFGQRLISINEIAEACRCSPLKLKDWFQGKLVSQPDSSEKYIDAGEVVAFLVRKSMPVSASLFPPNSKKLLFITPDSRNEPSHEQETTCILDFFRSNSNILVENTTSGKFADLTILTYSPDIVILYCQSTLLEESRTISLLENFSQIKTIIVTNLQNSIQNNTWRYKPAAQLVINSDVSEEHLKNMLKSSFSM